MRIDESLMNKDFHLTEMTIKENVKVQIYDNCLPLDVFRKIQDIFLGDKLPWGYNKEIVSKDFKIKSPIDGYDDDTTFQFSHGFYNISTYLWSNTTEIIVPILDILNVKAWIRVKANLRSKNFKHLAGGWHYDIINPFTNLPHTDSITAILYINTNNGYTLMETGDKIKNIENRLVLFPCNTLHTGIAQTDTKIKVTINFNFFSH